MTDTLKFKSVLVAKGYTIQTLSNKVGMSKATLSYKFNNHRQFVTSEIKAIQTVLGLSQAERDEIFFAENVE